MAIVGVVPLSWWWRLALGGAVVLSLYLALRAHGLRLAGAVTAVELDRDGSWALRFAGDASWHSCRLIDRWVQPRVVILRLRRDGWRRAHNVVIFADAVAAEPFRRLRARLRLEAAAA